MARVVNVGKRDRMVAGEILRPGEGKIVSPKVAQQYEEDTELKVTVDAVPEVSKVPEVPEVIVSTLPPSASGVLRDPLPERARGKARARKK